MLSFMNSVLRPSARSRRVAAGALFCVLTAATWAQAPAVTVPWTSIATGRTLALQVVPPAGGGGAPRPLVIYLENLPAPRVGTDSDAAILGDLRAAGYLVATLDYGRDPRARVPYLNRDLGKLRDDVRSGRLLPAFPVDPAHVYLVPSGCRLLRGVEYYQEPGRPLKLDLVYPSHPAHPVGAVIEFSCDNVHRMGNTSLSICSDTILDGEATEGLAVAMADHPVPPPYKGIDPMPLCAWAIRAAVRTLRAEGAALGLNGRIVPVGFSRGSGLALMLVTTAGMPEFEGHGAHPGVDSSVQGAVVMSGRFTYLKLLPHDHMLPRYAVAWGDRATHADVWRREGALDYLSRATLPLFLTINCMEGPDALYQMVVLRQRLAELGSDEIFMMDPEPRGHKVTLVPAILEQMNAYLHRRLAEPAP
jgi:hypothetical protein